MAPKTYFVMLRGREKGLLSMLIDGLNNAFGWVTGTLPSVKVLWAGLGDFVIDAPWILPPRSSKAWDVHLVVQEVAADNGFRPEHFGMGRDLASSLDIFALEVQPKAWEPSATEMKEAKKVEPAEEPQGIVQIFQRNWHKLFSVKEVSRNAARAIMILVWVFYHTFIAFDLLRPFQMVNLLKFDGGEDTYDLYRNAAGQLVIADGGHLAFLGKVVAPDARTFDEVMVVAYKHRLQFFRLALLTPGYWPLTFLRDEGLKDGMLHAVTPVALFRD